jgi:endonuclease G
MPKSKKQSISIVFLLLILVALALVEVFRQQPTEEGPQPPGGPYLANRNVRFGMPSPAISDPQNRHDFLIERPQYVLSYHEPKRLPNWVCWQLIAADIGKADRGPFEVDPLLPPGFAKVASGVYTGSGFDRGHICPSKDRSDSETNNDPTFYMTNIAPQAPALNQRAWERLESYCRTLAKAGNTLWICCGPTGIGGTGKDGFQQEIGSGRLKVQVPSHFWKVVLVVAPNETEPRSDSRVIAVVMPNDQQVGEDWTTYRVAAKEVEQLTGYRFFASLPIQVGEAIRSRVDNMPVQ